MLLIALPLSIALAAGIGAIVGLWQFLALPLLVVISWLLLRFNVPAEGRLETRLTSAKGGRAQIIGLGAVVFAQLSMVGLGLAGVDRSTACTIALLVMLVAFPPMLYLLHVADKQRRTSEDQAAELAPAVWREGESTAIHLAGQFATQSNSSE